MADDTVASLGFQVNSGELDQAKQKLSGLATEAGKTEKSVDSLNKSFVGLGSAVKGGAFGSGNANPFDAMTKGITAANKEIETTAPKVVGMGAAINAAIGKSAVSFNEMKLGVAAANTALNAHKDSVEKAAEGHVRLSNQSQSAAHSIRSLIEVIISGGSPIQALTQQFSHLSYAATGPGGLSGAFSGLAKSLGPMALALGGLAAAGGVGAAILALEKLNDEVESSKSHLAGLTGSTEGGAKAYDAVKAAAKGAGVEVSALTGAVDAAIIGQEQFANKNVIFADSADRVAKEYAKASAAFGTFGSILHGTGATIEQENAALKALGDTFGATGKFGADALIKIRSQSQEAALALANLFGHKTVKEFITELERMPIPLDEFERRMAQVDQRVKATLKPETPKNFAQALHDVKDAAHDVLEELAKIGAFDFFKNILTGTKGEIEAIGHPLDALGKKYKEIAADAKKDWSDFFSITEDKSSLWGGKITVDIDGAIHKVMISLRELSFQPITDFVNGAIAQFQRMAQGAVAAAQQAAQALSQIGKGGGGNASGLSGGGNPGSTDALGNVMGGEGGGGAFDNGSGTGGNAGTLDFGDLGGGGGGFTDNLPAFATGGQFTVTGSGGTDSQVVAFKSTPGETVTVSTPEQQSSSVQTLTSAASSVPTATATVKEITDAIDQSTINISKKVLEGSDAVVSAINKLAGGVAASTINPATGLPITSTSATFQGTADTSQNITPASVSNNPGFAEFMARMNKAAGGFSLKGGLNPTQDAIDKAKAANRAEDNKDPIQLSRAGASGFSFGQATPIRGSTGTINGRPVGRYQNPDNAGSYSFGQVDPMAGYYDDSYPMVDPMNGDAYSSPYSYDGSTAYGSNDAGSNYFSDYGGSTDSGITGADTSAMNYGGGSYDAGYFATGGTFKVPGSSSSGVDKTLVSMHLTPGETVSVTPNGISMPSQTAAASVSPDPGQATTTTTKNVIINVQAGIQAESFIRSRAQIARGF